MVLNNKQQMHNTLIAQSCCLFWDQSVLTEKVSVLVSTKLSHSDFYSHLGTNVLQWNFALEG